MDTDIDTAVKVISCSHSPYRAIYHGLQHREIRLVKLLQGQWSDIISCQLFHAHLDEKPFYKALSYVWGSPRLTRPVLINGHCYPVTVNLESALRRIRQSDNDLVIWIDALCINQSSNAERTEQVGLMHNIYVSAEEVIVYLGEVFHNGSTPLSKNTRFYCDDRDIPNLQLFKSSFTPSSPSMTVKGSPENDLAVKVFCMLRILATEPGLNHFPAFDSMTKQFTKVKYLRSIFEGLRQLLRSRWWNRVWVIQEVVVPKKVTMVYGCATAPWSMFVRSAHWERRNSASTSALRFPREFSSIIAWFTGAILDIERMRQLWRDSKHTPLLPLLRRFSNRKASDDRDKVYALLSLAQGTTIVSNYSLSVAQVYQNALFDIIKSTHSLAALFGDLGQKNRQDLPSWVPDWSATYDDLDRRRTDNNWNDASAVAVYIQEHKAKDWDGLVQYLDAKWGDTRQEMDRKSWYNQILENVESATSPEKLGDLEEEECLERIKEVFKFRGIAVCLEDLGDGCIRLPGRELDRVAFVGETAFSEEGLSQIIYSWAVLFLGFCKETKQVYGSKNIGKIFRATLCANRVPQDSNGHGASTRPLDTEDHKGIARWLWLESEFPQLHGEVWNGLFGDLVLDSRFDRLGKEPRLPYVEKAIKLATVRRKFFITSEGYVGLGPNKVSVGDALHYIPGSHAPFILREAKAPPRNPRREAVDYDQWFEIIGATYTYGFREKEIIDNWRAASNVACEIERRTLMRDVNLPHRRLDQWRNALQPDWLRTKIRRQEVTLRRDKFQDTRWSPVTLLRACSLLASGYGDLLRQTIIFQQVLLRPDVFQSEKRRGEPASQLDSFRSEVERFQESLQACRSKVLSYIELIPRQKASLLPDAFPSKEWRGEAACQLRLFRDDIEFYQMLLEECRSKILSFTELTRHREALLQPDVFQSGKRRDELVLQLDTFSFKVERFQESLQACRSKIFSCAGSMGHRGAPLQLDAFHSKEWRGEVACQLRLFRDDIEFYQESLQARRSLIQSFEELLQLIIQPHDGLQGNALHYQLQLYRLRELRGLIEEVLSIMRSYDEPLTESEIKSLFFEGTEQIAWRFFQPRFTGFNDFGSMKVAVDFDRWHKKLDDNRDNVHLVVMLIRSAQLYLKDMEKDHVCLV